MARIRDHAFSQTSSRSEEHTSELQSQSNLVCRLLLEKKNSTTLPSLLAYGSLVDRQNPCHNEPDRQPPSAPSMRTLCRISPHPAPHYLATTRAPAHIS